MTYSQCTNTFHKRVDAFMKRTSMCAMPVIAVNLAAGVFAEVRTLVEKGLYASPEQFMEIAAFNQLALERGATPEEVVAHGHRDSVGGGPSGGKSNSIGEPPRPLGEQQRARAGGKAPAVRTRKSRGSTISEDALRQALVRTSKARCIEPPAAAKAAPRPANERVYGLVNRLFPLKVACRWILVANSRGRRWEKHDVLREQLAADAATIGSALEKADLGAGRKRDELLSTGLPRQGNIASQDRFLSQYVARTTRAGEIYPGAICQFALAHFDGERLALTERGVDLARHVNSVLDGGDNFGVPAYTLTPEERAFFVEQAMLFVPGELHDYQLVLSAVGRGSATPDDLLTALRVALPQAWTPLMLRSHVSGIVARLAELGALQRHWEGRNVRYESGTFATELLATAMDGVST
jgi:hypothetical protein